MAGYTEQGATFIVATGQTVYEGDRLKLSAGGPPITVAVAGAGEGCIGVALRDAAAGASVAVKLMTDSGTFRVRAAGAITALAYLYGAASGEVDDTATGSAQFVALQAASNADEIIEALAVNLTSAGESGTGLDFVLYGDTAGAEVTFDQSADVMIFDGIDLLAQDSDFVKFGDASDITMTWDGTSFKVAQATANSMIELGVDGAGIDLKLYGDTASSTCLWDQSADLLDFNGADLRLQDSDIANFGDANDITMTWDGTQFVINQATANSAIHLGVDGAGLDVKFFGDTASSYMLWDQSADKLIINAGTADLGTSCEADAYTVGGTAGADFGPAAPASITVVKGIVTAASS